MVGREKSRFHLQWVVAGLIHMRLMRTMLDRFDSRVCGMMIASVLREMDVRSRVRDCLSRGRQTENARR